MFAVFFHYLGISDFLDKLQNVTGPQRGYAFSIFCYFLITFIFSRIMKKDASFLLNHARCFSLLTIFRDNLSIGIFRLNSVVVCE